MKWIWCSSHSSLTLLCHIPPCASTAVHPPAGCSHTHREPCVTTPDFSLLWLVRRARLAQMRIYLCCCQVVLWAWVTGAFNSSSQNKILTTKCLKKSHFIGLIQVKCWAVSCMTTFLCTNKQKCLWACCQYKLKHWICCQIQLNAGYLMSNNKKGVHSEIICKCTAQQQSQTFSQ